MLTIIITIKLVNPESKLLAKKSSGTSNEIKAAIKIPEI